MVTFGGVTAPVVNGAVESPELLAAVYSSEEFAAWTTAENPEPLQITYALANPIDAVAVPPAAIFDLRQSAACLMVPGGAVPVTILSSMLGQTLVRVESGIQPREVEVRTNESGEACR